MSHASAGIVSPIRCSGQPTPTSRAPLFLRWSAPGRNGPCRGRGACRGVDRDQRDEDQSGSTTGAACARLHDPERSGDERVAGAERNGLAGLSNAGKATIAPTARASSIATWGLISRAERGIAADDRRAAQSEVRCSASRRSSRARSASATCATNALRASSAARRTTPSTAARSPAAVQDRREVTGPPWPFAGNPLTPQTSGGNHVHRTRVRAGTAP